MRNRNGRRRKRGKTSVSVNYKALLVLLLVGVGVYAVCASSVGTFIAQSVIAPIFTAIKGTPAQGGSPDPSISPGDDNAINIGGNSEGKVTLKALNCYALQMGAYSSAENADIMAQKLRGDGAAGYILFAEERHRVLAAGYSSESSATSVRTRLVNEGHDCTLFRVQSGEEQFLVTSSGENISKIEAAFSVLYDSIGELETAYVEFDREELTPAEGVDLVKPIYERVDTVFKDFSISTENFMIAAIEKCLEEYSSKLLALSELNIDSSVDFSSNMKYTHLELTALYSKLADTLGGGSK